MELVLPIPEEEYSITFSIINYLVPISSKSIWKPISAANKGPYVFSVLKTYFNSFSTIKYFNRFRRKNNCSWRRTSNSGTLTKKYFFHIGRNYFRNIFSFRKNNNFFINDFNNIFNNWNSWIFNFCYMMKNKFKFWNC